MTTITLSDIEVPADVVTFRCPFATGELMIGRTPHGHRSDTPEGWPCDGNNMFDINLRELLAWLIERVTA